MRFTVINFSVYIEIFWKPSTIITCPATLFLKCYKFWKILVVSKTEPVILKQLCNFECVLFDYPAMWNFMHILHKCNLSIFPFIITWNFTLQYISCLYDLYQGRYLWMITEFLLWRRKNCVISYEIEFVRWCNLLQRFGKVRFFAVNEFVKHRFIWIIAASCRD